MLVVKVCDYSNWEKQFIDYLTKRGYAQSTARDYTCRIRRILKSEGITIQKLHVDIDSYIREYREGKFASINKSSHGAYSSALIKFKEFSPMMFKLHNPQTEDWFIDPGKKCKVIY